MQRALVAVVILAAGIWSYSNSLGGVLVLDDPGAITFNPTIRSLGTALSPPPNTSMSGRPVVNFTFALNYALAPADVRDVFAPAGPGGPAATTTAFLRNIRGYHLTNLAIHLAAALVLFGVVRRTFLTPASGNTFADASTWLAGAVALVWVVHPLHTESVTYLVQRSESLVGLLLLLTLYCAIRASGPHAKWWTAAAIVSCALGMATKESMVVAPVLVWIWVWGQTGVRPGSDRGQTPGLLYGLFATWLVLIPIVLAAPRGPAAGFGAGGWTSWSYLLTQTDIVVHYLRLIVAPAPLVFHYGWPRATSLAEVMPQAAVLLTLAVLTIVALWRRHPIGFAGACFFLVLAPTSSIVPVATEVAAEHRLYLPAAAVIASLAGAYWIFASRWLNRGRLHIVIGALGTIVIAVTFGAATHARNRDYASEERLWADTVQKQPTSPRAQLSYALVLITGNRFAEAEPRARAAIALEPANPLAHRTLGFSLAGQGREAEAIPEIERAINMFPDDVVARFSLGRIYAAQGNNLAATAQLTRVVAARPDDGAAVELLTRLLVTSTDPSVRDPTKAIELAERLVRLTNGRSIESFALLAAAYADAGRFDSAVAAIDAGLALPAPDQTIVAMRQQRERYSSRRK